MLNKETVGLILVIELWLLTSDHLLVLFLHLGEDQDVVQIDHHNTFCYEIPEDVIHHGLEGGRTVSHSKEHY